MLYACLILLPEIIMNGMIKRIVDCEMGEEQEDKRIMDCEMGEEQEG